MIKGIGMVTSVTNCKTSVFLSMIVRVMLVSEPQHTQHVISSVWETCRYNQVQPCIKLIKDNNEFWHLDNSDWAQISQNFMVNILRKNQWFAKTFGSFSRNCRTQKSILDQTKFVPSAGIAIIFAELLTTVSPLLFLAVPIQWTFTMAF